MMLITLDIEYLHFWLFARLVTSLRLAARPAIFLGLTLTTPAGVGLTGKFFGVVGRTYILLEIAKCLAEAGGELIQDIKCEVRMHAKLGQTMPMSTYEQQPHDSTIVWLWKEAVKYWDGALDESIRSMCHDV